MDKKINIALIILLAFGAISVGAQTTDATATVNATTVETNLIPFKMPILQREEYRQSGIPPNPTGMALMPMSATTTGRTPKPIIRPGTPIQNKEGVIREDVRDDIKDNRLETAKRQAQLINKRLEVAIERVQKLSDRVAERLTKLEAEGVTTTVSRGHLAEAKTKLDEARTKSAAVKLAIETVFAKSMSKEALKSVQDLVKDASRTIQEAHKHVALAVSTVKPGINKPRTATTTSSIQVNAAKIVKPVNKKLFGTSMEEISRAQWVKPLDLSDPKLKAVLNELRPTMITLDNTQLGLPFYPENTGKLSGRIGIIKILERIGIESDEEGKKLYDKLKSDSYFNKNQPQHHNYDDILQFLETLDVKPEISIRIPVMLADHSDKLVNLKLNLSPETGADLVHYLNDKETTALGKLRAQNGHPKSYNIKYFILGNEFWSNHDRAGLSAEQIISQYKGFSRSLKQADPSVKVGINLVNDAYPHEFFKPGMAAKYSKRLNYNDNILPKVGKYLDLVTFHVYGGMGEQDLSKSLNEDQWRFVLAQSHLYEKYGMAGRHMGIADKYIKKPLIAIDEYSGPLESFGGALYNADYLIYLMNNNYDFATNWHLGLMEPHTKFGLIKVTEDKGVTSYIKRPTFYALKMFTNYFGDSLVASTSTSPTFSTQRMSWASYFNWPAENDIPAIKTIASVKGNDLYLLIINRDLRRDIKTKITINGFDPDPKAQVYVLNASDLNDTNETVSDNVVIRQSSFTGVASSFEFLVEKHSVTVLKLAKKW